MRLDLFLKTSRLVKRRANARELCDAGRVLVNGQPAKPGREIQEGQQLTLTFSTRVIVVEVLLVPLSPRAKDPGTLYRVVSETRVPESDDL